MRADKNKIKPIDKEIDQLLSDHYSDYRERTYLTPIFYIWAIKKNPEKYPILATYDKMIQQRKISEFLKSQGRVKRNQKGFTHGSCWMLPEKCIA
jgi:hypothetical protein